VGLSFRDEIDDLRIGRISVMTAVSLVNFLALGWTLSEMSTGGNSMRSRSFRALADWTSSDSPAEE
jgi:hypothetical protein